MKLQQAIQLLEAAGWTYLKKERDEFSNMMDYYFRTPIGNVQVYTLYGVRNRAQRLEVA